MNTGQQVNEGRQSNEIQIINNIEEEQQQSTDDMIQLQGSLVNKLIKRIFPDKIVTSDFKKEFSKLLSIFIFYVQSGQQKKKYGQSDILAFLDQQGLGKVAQDLRNKRKTKNQQQTDRKKQPEIMDIQDFSPRPPIF